MFQIPPSAIFEIGQAIFRATSDLVAEYKSKYQKVEEDGKFVAALLTTCEAAKLITKEKREYLLDGWINAAVQGNEQKLAHFIREIQHEAHTLYNALLIEMERLGAQDKPIYKSLKEQVEFFEKEHGQDTVPIP